MTAVESTSQFFIITGNNQEKYPPPPFHAKSNPRGPMILIGAINFL